MTLFKTVKADPEIFRPNTEAPHQTCHFVFTSGGLGDYINELSAMIWVAEKNPHVEAYIWANEPFLSVAKFVMKKYEKVTCKHPKFWGEPFLKEGDLVYNTLPKDSPINAPGAHLMDLGAILYCNLHKLPDDYNYLPEINYDGPWKWQELKKIKYAVFTPGHTHDTRAMPAKAFNELCDYTISKGITPVFLGKAYFHETANNPTYRAEFNEQYDFSKGIDLREKTTLLEATQIMKKAKFVLGIDNGLLHFAGCTDVPIIFGHTITVVEHRDIRRKKGLTINLAIDQKLLACSGCQSRMRYIKLHRFSKCIYDDYKCLKLLFNKDSETWKQAIDYVLNEK